MTKEEYINKFDEEPESAKQERDFEKLMDCIDNMSMTEKLEYAEELEGFEELIVEFLKENLTRC